MSVERKLESGGMLYPASAAQQRLWFLYQLDSSDTSYNMSQSFRLRGKLNRAALCDSLNHIVARHSVLRTTFTVREHFPMQYVCDTLRIELPVTDVSSRGVDWDDAAVQQLIDEEVRRPFDLEQGPLVRAVLYRLSPDDHVILIIEHHIIFDRTSVGLLVEELTVLYEHYDRGNRHAELRLPELPIQYSDYALWRLEKNQSDTLERQLDYWQKRLADSQPLDMPTDRARSGALTTRGEQLYLDLPAGTVKEFAALSRENGATMFIGLLAAFNVLIHQWTGNSDMAVGTPFSDRRLNGTKEMLGFFVNNIVLRSSVSDDVSFLENLRSVRKVCFSAYRNNSVPFEKMVEHLKPHRQENRNPLFDVQFAYQKHESKPLILGDLSISPFIATKKTSQYDLAMTVREQATGYNVRVEYRKDLFDAETIWRLMRRFSNLLDLIVRNPTLKLSEIPLLTGEERALVVDDWNDTSFDYPADHCIHQMFEEQAKRTPDAIAVSGGGESISFGGLEQRANRLANHLQCLGVGPEKIVAICVERSVELIIGLLAILKAGAAYLPLDRTYPDDRLSHMLDDSGATVLLTQSGILDELPQNKAKTVLLDGDADEIASRSDTAPASGVTAENLAYVIYTSGSTGMPKGVQLEHRNVVNFLSTMRQQPGMTSDDVLLAVTTLSFDIAVLEIYLPLITGARIVIASHEVAIDGARLLDLMTDEQATVMQATPVTWRMLIEAGWQGGAEFKVLCGGEAITPDLAEKLVQRAGKVWNMYGPTETTVWSTCYRIDKVNGPLPIGWPIGNTTTYILDRHMRPVPVGVTGELYIGGDGVARGYLNHPELNNEKFVPSPFDDDPAVRLYATGDATRFLPDGNIQYLNRLDNQVKVRGNRIELGEIQTAIVACSEVGQAVVIVREDQPGDPRIVAYFIVKSASNIGGTELRKRLRASLPAFMIPQFFIELESFPLTPNGKLDRKALPAPDLGALTLKDSYRAPRTKLETSLASIWMDLLGLDKVGIHDNFVELGGHSLLALQAISRIRQDLDVNVSAISMIMDTLEQIAAQFDDESPVLDDQDRSDAQASNMGHVYFGPDGALLGSYHQPAVDGTRDSSILLCGPIYIESITANWAMRRLADQLSRLGYHVLRFDYFGSGDSQGESHEGNVTQWLQDIRCAAGQLATLSGIEKVSVVGLRFGATLASMSGLENLGTLVLWDPVTCGRDYMKYLQSRHQSMIVDCNAHRKKPISQTDNELLGYYCSPESRDMIENTRIVDDFENNPERVVLVIPEYTQDHGQFEEAMTSAGKTVIRHVVEDARCDVDEFGSLKAFLPGPTLRVITSVFSEQDK